jgi:hypothetical protein
MFVTVCVIDARKFPYRLVLDPMWDAGMLAWETGDMEVRNWLTHLCRTEWRGLTFAFLVQGRTGMRYYALHHACTGWREYPKYC